MKKVLAVLLSALLALTCFLPALAAEKTITNPASGYADYDKAAVAQNNADYIASMNYDQIASLLLDWLDRKISAVTADFNNFEVDVFGQTVEIPLDITGVDSLLQYKDHIAELGGDFANLDVSALNKTRADGDVNFLFSVFEFMAANADTFGKVFRWDDQVFDYGKVGEYIETLDAEDPIRVFYNDYLVGGDIQKAFTEEIAREMDYTIPEGEIFDDTLNNGIKAKFLEIFGDLLSEESKAAINDNEQFDLRTMDIYSMVKKFVGLLQNDYKAQLDDVLEGFLKALQGMIKVVAEGVNVEPPTVTVGDANNTAIGTYHPGETDFEAYMPKIYSPYKEQLNGTDFYDMIEGEALPEDLAALVSGDGVDMAEKFVMNVAPVPAELTEAGFSFPLEISFADIEAYANAAIAETLAADTDSNGVGDIQDQVNAVVDAAVSAANNLPVIGGSITGSVTINSITVSLAYKGYATDDSFVVEVTAVPDYNITYGGNVWTYASMVGITQEKIQSDYIQPAVAEFVKNPAATVVVTNLSGTIEELAQLQDLIGYIDADAAYDETLLDVSADYDEYKGVVGQANHILYKTVNMIASDAGMEYLGLTDGTNAKLTENLQKICDKVSGLMDTMKKYIDRDTFVALADGAGISDVFASAHGFNAGMIYDMDFSSIENALDCGIRVACDLLAEDDPESIFYDFHIRVENLDTLDAIAAAAVDMILGKVTDAVDFEGWDYTYTPIDYKNVAEDGAEDAIMDKVVDILYYAATWSVAKVNDTANSLIADLNADLGLGIGQVNFKLGVEKSSAWATTLSALTDRFIGLSNGVLIASGNLEGMKDVWSRLNGLVNAVLPMNTMFSNYTSLTALRSEFYDDALDGDLVGLLSHFEVKEDAIAGNVPVTFAFINASDYIVDAFFPETVQAELYQPSAEVQQEFTGNESDQGIAARNMVSINGRKTHLLPALLDLIREAGLLPSFACDHTNVVNEPEVASTCQVKGHAAGKKCADCGMIIEGCEEYPLAGHSFTVLIDSKDATCTAAGYKIYKCADCDATETRDRVEPLGHDYQNGVCTRCNEPEPTEAPDDGGNGGNFFTNFWQKIVSFFERLRNFFKNLFNI